METLTLQEEGAGTCVDQVYTPVVGGGSRGETFSPLLGVSINHKIL